MHRTHRWTATLMGLALLLPLLSGCTGGPRRTTTARTATEQLLVSTAVDRALAQWGLEALAGRDVALDVQHLEAVDKTYVVSALREALHGAGARVTDDAPVVLEVRSGTVGINDEDWLFGIPALPIPLPNTSIEAVVPEIPFYKRISQRGWARLHLFAYERETGDVIAQSGALWGRSVSEQWRLFIFGPFPGKTDIWPEQQTRPWWRIW